MGALPCSGHTIPPLPYGTLPPSQKPDSNVVIGVQLSWESPAPTPFFMKSSVGSQTFSRKRRAKARISRRMPQRLDFESIGVRQRTIDMTSNRRWTDIPPRTE
jgi:hypothetical protein